MNVEASVVLFDSITKRKEYLSQRIESCVDVLKHLVGNERKEILVELDLHRSEEKWLLQFQLDFMRALLNGGK
jgi:hypothetical protein